MNTSINSLALIRARAAGELSLRARLGYIALLLVSAGMLVVIASLWLTEVSLPLRAQLAFGVMTFIGSCWATFALWTLATRRVLFARDSVIAGWMSVAFTSMFVAGALAAVIISGRGAAFGALATGVLMLSVAARVLSRARRRFSALTARRQELERILADARS